MAEAEHVVRTRAGKLEIVPASLVTAILTEYGPLGPAEIAAAAAESLTPTEHHSVPSRGPQRRQRVSRP